VRGCSPCSASSQVGCERLSRHDSGHGYRSWWSSRLDARAIPARSEYRSRLPATAWRTSAGRCSKGVDVLSSLSLFEAQDPQGDGVVLCSSTCCPVPTVKARRVFAMARPVKARNDTAAARSAGRDAHSSWTLPTLGQRLPSSARGWIGPCMRAGCAIQHASDTSVPTPVGKHAKKGPCPPTGACGGLEACAPCGRGRDVGTPAEPRWLGHASDPPSGTVWAYGCGRRQDEVCRQLQEL
jgi:hypothetical protein